MKKIIALMISFILLLPTAAFATVGQELKAVGKLPKSAYIEPHADNLCASVYAPWIKLMHITTKAQKENGLVGGESCQQIRSLAISPHDENLILCGTDTNGIWKTKNGGEYWYSTGGDYFDFLSIQNILFHPTDPDTVYMVSASNNSTNSSRNSTNDGIYRSRDRGETWEHIFHTLYAEAFFDKLLAFDKNGILYAVSGAGVFKSADDGTTWENAGLTFDEIQTNGCSRSISVSSDGQNIIVAYGRYSKWDGVGIYCTCDGGKTWNKTAPTDGMAATITDILPNDSSVWYAGFTAKDNFPTGLYKSVDYGKSWSIVSELPAAPSISMFGPQRSDGSFRYYIQFDEIVDPLRYSDDFGMTWQKSSFDHSANLNTQYTGYYAQGFDVLQTNPEIVYSARAGVHKSVDAGKSFAWKNSGISGLNVAGISFGSDDKMYLSCVDVGSIYSDNAYSADGETTFFSASDLYVNNVTTADPDNPQHTISYCYSSWRNPDAAKHLFESYDGGKTFSIIGDEKLPTQTFIEYSKDNSDIIYTNSYISTDHGKTWSKNENLLAGISPIDENVFYRYIGDKAETEVLISKDKGKTWETMGKVGFAPRNQISGGRLIYPDTEDVNSVFVVGEYKIVKMTFGKGIVRTFDASSGALIDGAGYWSFAQNPKNAKHLLIGQVGNNAQKNPGLIESFDGGDTWHAVPGIIGHRVVYYIKFSDYADEAFLCSMSGIMRYNYTKYKDFLDNKISVFYKGNEVTFDEMPQIKNNNIMLPLRETFEMLGATVTWNSQTQRISIRKKSKQVSLSISSDKATCNGSEFSLDYAPYIFNNKTFVPLRAIMQSLGLQVGWDTDKRMAVIEE